METKKLLKNLKHKFSGMLCLVMLLGFTTSAWAAKKTVYLNPSSDWKTSNAKFAAWNWGGTDGNWSSFFTYDSNSGYYIAEIDESNNNFIFLRCKNDCSSPGWDCEWTRIEKSRNSGQNLFSISGWNDGSWSTYTPVTYTWYLGGLVSDGWSNPIQLTGSGSTLSCVVSLQESHTYEGNEEGFKIIAKPSSGSDVYYGNSGTMYCDNCTGWTFSSSENSNCKILTAAAGDYTFSFNTENKQVSVTYAPSYYLKHPWGGGSWTDKLLNIDNGDGTYSLVAEYGNNGCNYKSCGGQEQWQASPTVIGSPAVGDECTFTYNPTNNNITITKIKTCEDPDASNFEMSDDTQTYTGSELHPTITTDGGMGTMTVKYDGTAGTGKTNAGTYAITVDVAAGSTYCAATGISLGDFVINKADQSALTFNGSTECVDTEVTLSATGGSSGLTITYAKKSGTGTVDGSTLTTDTAGDVEVTATCPGGTNYNDVTADATFTFVAKPVAGTVTGGGDICTKDGSKTTKTLTVAGYSGSIQWQKASTESGSYSDISSETSTTYTAGAAGWYRVKVYNAQCDPVYSNAVEVVGYNSTVAGNVSGATTICSGESATLTASGYKGTIRFWMVSTDGGSNWTNLTGETSSTYTPTNITTTSKYKVSVSGICGSGGSGSATVTVNPLNNVSNITFSPASIKKGETTQATATVTTVGGTGAWSTTTSSLISFSSTSANPTTISANGIGTAKVIYTLTGGCNDTSKGAVNSKTVDLVINSDCDVPSAGTISGTTAICAGSSVSLSVTGYTSTNTTLQWNKNGSPVAGKTSNTYTESNVTESATYTVTVTRTDVDNCSKTTDAGYEVTVTAIPTITAQGGERCGNGEVTLQATASPADKCTVHWYNAASGGTDQGTGLGKEVNVTVGNPVKLYAEAVTTDAAACKSASRASATATAKLVPSIASVTKTADACGDGNITFTATGATASSSIEWFENSVSVGTGGSKTFSNVPAGTSHSVTAKATLNGCESAETSPVTGTRMANPSLTIEVTSSAITAGETDKTYGWEPATFSPETDGEITSSSVTSSGSRGIISGNVVKGPVGDTFTGSYTATGSNGCTTSDSKTVTVIKAEEVCNN